MDYSFYPGIFIMNLLNYIDRGVIYTLLPIIKDQLHISKTGEGWLISSFMIGFTISSLLTSYLSNKVQRKYLLLTGYFIFFLSNIGMLFVQNTIHLVFLRAISGVGEGTYSALIAPILNDKYGEVQGNHLMSFLFSAINIGTAIGLLLGGVITQWRYIYIGFGILDLIIFIFLLTNQFPEYNDQITENPIREILENKNWLCAILSIASFNFSLGTLSSWIPTFYKNIYTPEISYQELSFILCLGYITFSVVGSLIGNGLTIYVGGRDLTKKYNIFRLCFILTLLLITSILISLFYSGDKYIGIGFFLLSLLFLSMLIIPTSLLSILFINPNIRSYSNSLCIFITHLIGDIPAPIISSYIWNHTNNLQFTLEICQLVYIIPIFIFGYQGFFSKNRNTSLPSLLLNEY